MAQPREFSAKGPYKVPVDGAPRQRYLNRFGVKEFWSQTANPNGEACGCYVFALRRGGGYVPVYVGKTTRRFDQECFTDQNYRKLHEAMRGQVGTLALFLLVYKRSRGRSNERVIGDLEKFLVEAALDRNPNLINKVYTTQQPGFAIPGLHRSGRGRPSKAAVELGRALGM